MKKCWGIPIWILKRASLSSQKFLKEGGILEDLEKAGIQEGDLSYVCMDLNLTIINKGGCYDK